MGDKNIDNANIIAKTMNDVGFDVVPFEMDLSSRKSILDMIEEAKKYGSITMLVNDTGVSPSQVSISSQSGFRMKQLKPQEDERLACMPMEELLNIDLLKEENIQDTLHAYQLAKRCNEKRVMAESVKWGEK